MLLNSAKEVEFKLPTCEAVSAFTNVVVSPDTWSVFNALTAPVDRFLNAVADNKFNLVELKALIWLEPRAAIEVLAKEVICVVVMAPTWLEPMDVIPETDREAICAVPNMAICASLKDANESVAILRTWMADSAVILLVPRA